MPARPGSADRAYISRMRLRALPVLALLGCLFAAACSSGSPGPSAAASVATASPAAAAPSPSRGATAAPAPSIVRIADTFDIGGGRHLYLECTGTGSPTILLEAGDEDRGTRAWGGLVPSLSAETRACTYDRAGLGRSSPATGCRQLADLVDDLDALLAAADVAGPFVLVGASGGGFIMAGFAARHPEQVAGMVFVEVPKALTAELYPEVLPQIACDAEANIERRDYLAVEHAAWDNRKELGDFPLTVMSNDYGDSVEPNTDEATNVEDQRGWFVLSPKQAKQSVVTSGHSIPDNQPDLVIRVILAVLAAARGG